MKPYHARSIFIIPFDLAGDSKGIHVDPGLVLRKPLEVHIDGVRRDDGFAEGELQMRRYELPKTRGVVTAVGSGVREVAPGDIVAFPPNHYDTADRISEHEYAMHIDNVLVVLAHWHTREMETADASNY
jgi:hypothetical protein